MTTMTPFAWLAAVVAIAARGFAHLHNDGSKASSEVRAARSGTTVARELRALSRPETASLRMQEVIELEDRQTRLVGLVDANDESLSVAAGEVVLGVDFARLGEADVPRIRRWASRPWISEPEGLSARFDE